MGEYIWIEYWARKFRIVNLGTELSSTSMDETPFCGAAVFGGHISVNIYEEVLAITRYSKFSSKLYAALSKNLGKDIAVYVKDVQNIWIDIRPYFPLDYNYMY